MRIPYLADRRKKKIDTYLPRYTHIYTPILTSRYNYHQYPWPITKANAPHKKSDSSMICRVGLIPPELSAGPLDIHPSAMVSQTPVFVHIGCVSFPQTLSYLLKTDLVKACAVMVAQEVTKFGYSDGPQGVLLSYSAPLQRKPQYCT